MTLPAEYKGGDPVAGSTSSLTAGCTGCHTLTDAGSTGTVGPNLDQAKPPATLVYQRVTEGAGADAVVQGHALDQADRRRDRLRDEGDRRQRERLIELPANFPRAVRVIATDFDHTLVWKDGELRPRTIAALAARNDAGLRVIVVTGRMVQSVQRTRAARLRRGA